MVLQLLNPLYLTCALILLLSLPCKAQQRVSLGPMVGSVLSSFYGKDADHSTWKTGFLVGGFVTYSRQPHNGVTAEVYFIKKGERYQAPNPDSASVQHIYYVEVPFLFKYFTSLSPEIRPVFFGGPALSYRLGAINQMGGQQTSNNSQFTNSDLGITLGAGSSFNVHGRWLNLDIRYTLGITEVFAATAPRPGRVSNHNISSTISFGWGAGKKY